MKIAVVGGGVSGLSAAWLLRNRHDVQLFEADPWIGGHTRTRMVTAAESQIPLDMGFIVFNETTYPNLTRLFNRLDVESQATDMSLSVRCERCDLEYGGRRTGVFAQTNNLLSASYHRMLLDIVRFNRLARRMLADGTATGSLGSFLKRSGLGPEFGKHYLVPLTAALWSAGTTVARKIPLSTLLQFMENHGLLQLTGRLQWRTVVGGSQSYVARMVADLAGRVHVATPVARVCREGGGITLHLRTGQVERFDQVVVATHADQALRLLDQPSDGEREMLGQWRYSSNRTLLHTDTTLLPKRQGAWASWNYGLRDCESDQNAASVSYHLNRLQRLDSDDEYVVTLNPDREPAARTLIGEEHFTHPIYTPESVQTQSYIPDLNGVNRTWFCGAYCGFGFHEDGLNSALRVADGLGGASL